MSGEPEAVRRPRVAPLATALALLHCSPEPAAQATPSSPPQCTWAIEYSRHRPVDDPPNPSRIGGLELQTADLARVSLLQPDVSAPASPVAGFDSVEIELSETGTARLAQLHGDSWQMQGSLAARAVLRIAGAQPDGVRLVAGFPAPVELRLGGSGAVLRMPVIEGSLRKVREACSP